MAVNCDFNWVAISVNLVSRASWPDFKISTSSWMPAIYSSTGFGCSSGSRSKFVIENIIWPSGVYVSIIDFGI